MTDTRLNICRHTCGGVYTCLNVSVYTYVSVYVWVCAYMDTAVYMFFSVSVKGTLYHNKKNTIFYQNRPIFELNHAQPI